MINALVQKSMEAMDIKNRVLHEFSLKGKYSVSDIVVSVVMPVYNEGNYVRQCVDSLLAQDYPKEQMEFIFVDGCSQDDTVRILHEFQKEYPALIKVLNNPKKIVPCAMNIGIRESKGEYVVRMDAHAMYESNYITQCVFYLDHTDADNVGGTLETKSRTPKGEKIARMLSSRFGVGNSKFRTDGKDGYVDTVPFGAFRRGIFSTLGGYDERLVRNQDNEMNYRIRKNGGKILLTNSIRLSYYCRDTVGDITKMARTNGRWNVITMKMCPGSMGARHFVPLVMVISLFGLTVLGPLWKPLWWLLGAEAAAYLLLDILFSAKASKNAEDFFALLFLFPSFHVSYGIICFLSSNSKS